MKRSKAKTVAPPAWHPDFRLAGELPDIKAVRTTFLLNALAVVFVLVAGLLFYQRETMLNQMRDQTEYWQTVVDSNRARYTEALRQQREFSEAENKFNEIARFTGRPLVLSDFLERLGATLPRLMVIDVVEQRDTRVFLRGALVGSSERATELANNYTSQLAADPAISAAFTGVKLNTLNRDARTNRLIFEIELTMKPQP
jgi:hypothetical protein